MKAYYNENKFYNHLEEWVGAVLLAVMVVMLFVQVVMRYNLRHPLHGFQNIHSICLCTLYSWHAAGPSSEMTIFR